MYEDAEKRYKNPLVSFSLSEFETETKGKGLRKKRFASTRQIQKDSKIIFNLLFSDLLPV